MEYYDSSDFTQDREDDEDSDSSSTCKYETETSLWDFKTEESVVIKLANRQMFGKFARRLKARTERLFRNVHDNCVYSLDQMIPDREYLSHIFMGFSVCGTFFISYTTNCEDLQLDSMSLFPNIEYVLYVWKFRYGEKLQFVSKHRIFKLFKNSVSLARVYFVQVPSDPYKILCFGISFGNPGSIFLSILTLPMDKCIVCSPKTFVASQDDDAPKRGWCLTHGFMANFMFVMNLTHPTFKPNISLAYPDHVVINVGHCLHVLNISISHDQQSVKTFNLFTNNDRDYKSIHSLICNNNSLDNVSEVSESPSELFSANNSIVDSISEDFSENDFEAIDHIKPFHELNISCEPLNVTGKNYHNNLVQNIVDTRLKHFLQTSNKDCVFSVPQTSGLQPEKSKIDKNIAEKAYEFIEENEKCCENLSLFRKKRLADKKYEFSEDNSENIVPFYSLRRERRYYYRSQSYCIKSPDFSGGGLFLSPRSPGLRSPMQSPNAGARSNGQFSPGGARNLPGANRAANSSYSHHSKSPISPRESGTSNRKLNVYSPSSVDSESSDSTENRHLLKQLLTVNAINVNESKIQQQQHHHQNLHGQGGLLIVDSKIDDTPKWIKKVVKRYSSVDFENSSLLSGQSRDDYNIPIEIPLLVQNLADQPMDIVPEAKIEQVCDTQVIINQRTFDYDEFVQSRAQKLCAEYPLKFLHCEDYDIKVVHVCPLNGDILCKATITICALKELVPKGERNFYTAPFLFTWNIPHNLFKLLEPPSKQRMLYKGCNTNNESFIHPVPFSRVRCPTHRRLHVMKHLYGVSASKLVDYDENYEIRLSSMPSNIRDFNYYDVDSSDTD